MDPSVGEYFKLKYWVDHFMQIPFNKFNNLPDKYRLMGLKNVMNLSENSISQLLDNAVYGIK